MPTSSDIAARFAALSALCTGAPSTAEQRTEHDTLIARQIARDEAKRAGHSPQAALDLDMAA